MKTKTALMIGGSVALLAYLLKNKGMTLYNQVVGEQRLTVNLHNVDKFEVHSGNVYLRIKLQIINSADVSMTIDDLFCKIYLVTGSGDKNLLFQTNPAKNKNISVKPNRTTIVSLSLMAPLMNLATSVLSILATKKVLLEVSPTVGGVALPVINHSIDFDGNIIKEIFKKKNK